MTHLPTPQPNRSRFAMVFLLFMSLFLGSVLGWGQTTQTFNYTGSNQTFTIPAGVTSVTVECWGGGAAGSNIGGAAGGGGGGAYTKGTLTGLTPGNSLTIIVGAGGTVSATQSTTDGGNSSVSTIVANGGKTVVNSRTGGSGGAASSITGNVTVSFAGGNGGNAAGSSGGNNNEAGGGGGGSALTTAVGSNGSAGGSSTSNATTGGSGTGAGGSGAAADGSPSATAGSVPGGGGGGRGEGTSTSQSGAHGSVVITYCASNVTPNVTISSNAASNTICSGTSVTFTATPTNGGSAPTYQWKLNGANVGTGGTTYSNSALANNDIVSVVMTANNVCQTASTATSSGITMTINTTPTAPIASNQIVAFGSTVYDLIATGNSLQWYSASTGGSALASITALSAVTYYVSQTVGSCQSARTAVVVFVGSAGGSIITNTSGTYSFLAPAFVKGFEVETWGGGGGGGGASRASGGGGGAYAKSYLVNSGSNYSVTVGAGGAGGVSGAVGVQGGNTIFGSSLVLAEGGKRGTNGNNVIPASGVGGSIANSTGTTKYAGGSGGLGRSGGSPGRGGGGGSSAGSAAGGNNGLQGGSGSAASGGAAVTEGGAGGIGGDNDNGGNGAVPGGGGGGASDSGIGGNGGNGRIKLTYVDISDLTFASATIVVCNNSTATITLNSTSLANGNYYVYYSTTWNGTTTVQSKVYMTFNSGTTAGTFTTVALPNAGSNTITITRIENSSETDIYSEPTTALTKSVTVRSAFTSGTISSTGETICSGGTPSAIGNNTVASGGDDVITYSWRSSADSYVAAISGATSSTYIPPSGLTATTSYRRYANDGTCNATPTVSVGTWTGTVNPNLPASVSISASATTICSGTSVTFTATPTNGGTAPSYQWKINGTNAGTNSATFTSTTLANTDAVTCVMTSNATPCLTGSPTTSNSISMTVNPILTASISIGATATTICSGTSVTFTATPTNGGTIPSYQWKVNGTNAGTNSATYTSTTLANNDAVTCVMTSNATPCLSGSPATSNSISMTVNPILTASVSISASATGICSGNSITVTAVATNGGNSPAYVWKKNGVLVSGQNNATFTSGSFANGDVITCEMTSNASPCLAGSPATSNSVTITVNPIVTPTFTQVSAICSGASLSALPTTSNNSITGIWSPAVNNTVTTTYTFTPTAGQCASTASMTITVTPSTTYYADADGDGYGNAGSTLAACSLPTGYVTNNTDCNDNSNAVNPGASELCNNSDDNCNSQIDEGASNSVSTFITACATYTWSANNTSYTTSGNYTSGAGCNTQVLHLTITAPALTYYVDADQDGFGAGAGSLFCANPGAGYSTANTDCNDANVSISPMAEELCDGIDNDCNASTIDGLGTTTYFRDADNDGFGNPNLTTVSCQSPSGYVADNTDCDDNNAAYHIVNTYFQDYDNDTYGNGDAAQNACFLTNGYSVNHDDCDDTNALVNPGATEVCNLIDDNCDGVINDGLTSVDYHFDGDGDGYGSGVAILSCAPITNYVQNSADCNDSDAAINPNATEICGNTVDEDCNAGDLVPTYYTSRQSGAWTSASTWNKSCDNTTYDLALSAPQDNYAGIVTIAATHTVTVGTNDAYVASAGNLNINATGSLIVNGKMSLSQTLVNNGTLTVNNGASFLQSSPTGVNTGNGSYVVNLNLTGTSANGTAPNGRYWYLGSPMNNTNIYNTFYNTGTMTRVWSYLSATNAWSPIINSSTGVGVNSATNMAVGIGYLYRAGSAQSVTFNGTSSTFNNNVTTPLSFTEAGYKYVANPYTSHLDWKLITRTGLNVSYWIRNAMNTSYESYNATSGISTNNGSGQTTQFIPPMQGFWIYAYTTPCSLRMDNGDRVHSSNALHTPEHNQVVRLNLNDGKSDDQAVVYENENASNGIEEYDTDKFMDENHHQVYFLEGTKQVSLDGLKDATAKQKVDMGIQITSAGTYTINAAELGVEEDVMLEDKFTHTFQDMKLNNTYSFTANAGTFNNRFVLHFTLNPQTETAMEIVEVGETVGESEGVSVYTTTGQQVKVWVTNTAEFQNATVKVYDAIGNLVERKNMTSSELLLDLNTATGVYLVEVTGADKTFTKKVFITK